MWLPGTQRSSDGVVLRRLQLPDGTGLPVERLVVDFHGFLGRGAFGDVFAGTLARPDGSSVPVAAKFVQRFTAMSNRVAVC